MSTLILFAPPRHRLQTQGRGESLPAAEYDFLFTPDGQQISDRGRRPVRGLPTASQVVLLLADADVAWRRVDLPRAGRQMRPALAGLLEENLLDDPEQVHFALEPDAGDGDTAWVALCARPWLAQHLAQLEASQVFVDRVLPLSWPQAASTAHFVGQSLYWSHAEGVTMLPLAGDLARQLFTPALIESTHWSAEPEAVVRAQTWLGITIAPLSADQRALAALQGPWNLRQFDLAQHTRGIRALRQGWQTLMQRSWRPVRWGFIGLVIVQLLGLNLLAWQRSHELSQRRAALNASLKQAFPEIRSVLDAPAQAQRQIELLRASAGREGPGDMGTLMSAAAAAWPPERDPVESLHFEPGRLMLSANGWTGPQIEQFKRRLEGDGWALDVSQGRMTLSRGAAQK